MRTFRRIVSLLLTAVLLAGLLPLTAKEAEAAVWVEDIAVLKGGESGTIITTGSQSQYARTNLGFTPSNSAMAYVTVYDPEGEVTANMVVFKDVEIAYNLLAGSKIQVDVIRGTVTVGVNYVNGATRPDVVIGANDLKPKVMAQYNVTNATLAVGETLQLYLAWADSRYYAAHASDFVGDTSDGMFLSDGYGVQDRNVVTVDKNGLITAKGVGETKVYMAFKFGFDANRTYTFYTTCTIKVVGDYGVQEAYEDYYAAGNDKYFNIVVPEDAEVRTTGFNIQVGDQTYSTGQDYQMMITFPDNYTGDVVISKEGFVPHTLKNANLSAYNWVTLYPDTGSTPVIQSVLARSVSDSEWRNLKIRSLSIFEETPEEYVMDVQVDWRGKRGNSVWLQQGPTVIPVENGTTGNVPLGLMLKNSADPVVLCAMANDGTLVKSPIMLNVLSPEKYARLDFGTGGGLSGEYTGTEDAFQNLPFKLNLGGNISFEYVIDVDGKVKGTLGVSATAVKSTYTYYEDIKETVNRVEVMGDKWDTKARSKAAAELADRIEDGGGTVLSSRTDFAFDMASFSVMGYVEGKMVNGKLEVDELGMLCTIGAGVKISQDSLAFPAGYHWELSIKAQLEVPIKSVKRDETGKFQVTIPATTINVAIEGGVYLGPKALSKIAEIGVSLKATFTIKMPHEGQLSDSVWTLNVKFEPRATLFGYDYTDEYWDSIVDWQIYPYKDPEESGPFQSLTDQANYKLLPRSAGVNGMTFGEGDTQKDPAHFLTMETVATNTYTDSAPQLLDLGDKQLLVWLVDDTSRTVANRTSLHYAVYDKAAKVWSEPAAVLDDGTADHEPVLRKIDGKAYLLWSKASAVLEDDAVLSQTAEKLDIYFAEFNPETGNFGIPTNISGDNGVFDTDPQIVSTAQGLTVVWRQNSANDVFGLSGDTSVLAATLTENTWTTEVLASQMGMLSGITAYAENGKLVVCFSADTDGDLELFEIREGAVTQLTDNDHMDSLPTWENGVLYRYENDQLTDGKQAIPDAAEGGCYQYVSSGDGSFRAVLYTLSEGNAGNNIYASVYDGKGWSKAIPVTALENHFINDFTACYNGKELVIIANCCEVTADLTSGRTRIVKFTRTMDSDLGISDAYYVPYTLTEKGTLVGYANVTNNGMTPVERFTVTVMDENGTVLNVSDYDRTLPIGQTTRIKFYCDVADLPEKTIVIAVSSAYITDGLAQNDQAELVIGKSDISVENAFARLESGGKTNLTAFVVNRGLERLTNVTLTFRKGTPDGEVLGTTVVDAVDVGQSVAVAYALSGLSANDTVYVCAAQLENENIIANNTDFVVVQPCLVDAIVADTVVSPEDIENGPVVLDQLYFMAGGESGNEWSKSYDVTLIPEETGYYRLQMRWEEDGYSPSVYMYDADIITQTSRRETVGDKVYQIEDRVYYLEKGEEYEFTVYCYGLSPVRVVFSAIPEQIFPEQIILNKTELIGNEGTSESLEVSLAPDGSFGRLVYTSSDESVVTVDEDGDVTFRRPGTAVITVTVEGCEAMAQCAVTTLATEKTPLQTDTQYTALEGTFSFTPESDGFYQFNGDVMVFDDGWEQEDSASHSLTGSYSVDIYYMEAGATYIVSVYDADLLIHRFAEVPMDQTAEVVIDEGGESEFFTFIPEESGVYEICSTGEGDTYGYLYGKDFSEILKDDEGGEDSNFCLRFRAEAGEPYLIRAKYWSSRSTGSFGISARSVRYVTSMEILSLPKQTDYIEGFVENYLDYEGLKIRFRWSDGTFTDWTENEGYYLDGQRIEFYTENADTNGQVRIVYDGLEISFYVNIVENPVARLEVVASSVPTCMEDCGGYIDYRYNEETEESEEYFYYAHYPFSDVKVKIHFKDGTTKIGNIFDEVDGYWITYENTQDDQPWTVGSNNVVPVKYLGAETTFRVTVQPNPVASIQLVKGPDRTEFSNGYAPDFAGTTIRINYTNGTTKTVTATRQNMKISYSYFEGLSQTVMVDGYPLEFKQCWDDERWDYVFRACYMGRECDLESTYSITEGREIASVKVENVTKTGAGMLVHVTYEDGGTETLRFDQVACGGEPNTDVVGVGGYAITPNGLLEYSVQADVLDDDGTTGPWFVSVLGWRIQVELTAAQGDVNGDNKVNMKDWSLLYAHISETQTLPDAQLTQADVNGDGKVNMKDWIRLYNHITEVDPL